MIACAQIEAIARRRANALTDSRRTTMLQFLYPIWRELLAAVDRWGEAPIMRQRINTGSDEYFAWQEEHAGESELDEVFGVGARNEDDDD